MNNDLFCLATRKKFRFETPQGQLTTEDLWSLPLTTTSPNKANLDDIAISLNKKVRENGDTTSFVKKTTKSNDELQAKFDIVLHVIKVKQEEAEVEATKQENRIKKQRIMEMIEQKKDAEMSQKSVEELTALLAGM